MEYIPKRYFAPSGKMTTYNIHFINKYSQAGSNQDYAIFSDLPKLSHNPSSSPLYSNVFRATSLTRGESWNIGISNRHYAWCGTVDRKLSAFAKVVVDSGKLAVLGTQAAPGCELIWYGVHVQGLNHHSSDRGSQQERTPFIHLQVGSHKQVRLFCSTDRSRCKPQVGECGWCRHHR